MMTSTDGDLTIPSMIYSRCREETRPEKVCAQACNLLLPSNNKTSISFYTLHLNSFEVVSRSI